MRGQTVARFALTGMLVTIAGAGLAFVLAGREALPAFGKDEVLRGAAAASFAGSATVSRMEFRPARLSIHRPDSAPQAGHSDEPVTASGTGGR